MNKDFVPYHEALALKEIGYNKLTLRFYYLSLSREPISKINNECESANPYSDVFRILSHNKINKSASESFLISPTFSEAFRWFREKHNCYPCIWDSIDNLFEAQINDIKLKFPCPIKGTFKTYEEAELECLKKLIELVNENNTI